MYKAIALFSVVVLPLAGCARPETLTTASATALDAAGNTGGTVSATARSGGPPSGGVIYVTSQGLYFDTFVAVDPLPLQGPFQLLANGQTQFGPGNPGYLGGRWWEDLNGNGIQDTADHFFLCPLLPPGRPTP
jgi:hypothetical protein